MHINELLLELAVHLTWHFMLEMTVGLFSYHYSQEYNCHLTRKRCEERNATMGQENRNQSLTLNKSTEFNLLFWSVVRDGPVQ